MEWINEPKTTDSTEGKGGGCPVLDWICKDLCLANCKWCAIYIYSDEQEK